MNLKAQFGLALAPNKKYEVVTLWINDNKVATELIRTSLPFYETRLEVIKKGLLKRVAMHLYEEGEIDLTDTLL